MTGIACNWNARVVRISACALDIDLPDLFVSPGRHYQHCNAARYAVGTDLSTVQLDQLMRGAQFTKWAGALGSETLTKRRFETVLEQEQSHGQPTTLWDSLGNLQVNYAVPDAHLA